MTKALTPSSIFRNALVPSDFFKSLNDFCKGLPGFLEDGWELRGFPSGELSKKDGKIKIELALAGYSKEQLSVSAEDDCVVITATKREESDSRVLARRGFKKAYYLGRDVDWDKLEAEYKDGLLTVTVPEEKEDEKEAKQIEIK